MNVGIFVLLIFDFIFSVHFIFLRFIVHDHFGRSIWKIIEKAAKIFERFVERQSVVGYGNHTFRLAGGKSSIVFLFFNINSEKIVFPYFLHQRNHLTLAVSLEYFFEIYFSKCTHVPRLI